MTGSGDIAPAVPGQGANDVTVAAFLVGTFAGLIAMIVVATMFITAEYRRGLIRVTWPRARGGGGCWRRRPS